MSGLRFLQIANGLPYPVSTPLVDMVLRGIRRLPQATRRLRYPVTPEVMSLLFRTWSQMSGGADFDAAMLWAACCTAFFGFLRAGEFTCPSLRAFTSTMLSASDVSVDSYEQPSVVTVHLRQSKTDPFGTGVYVHLGRTGQEICPVSALLSYMVRRGQQPGPLFTFQDGRPLSRQRLINSVNQALSQYGVDTSGITGHSFRIGAATAAARAGLEDSRIQTLGRWRSAAFTRYIRTPVEVMAASSASLLGPTLSDS